LAIFSRVHECTKIIIQKGIKEIIYEDDNIDTKEMSSRNADLAVLNVANT